MSIDYTDLLKKTRALLRYHGDSGIESYPDSEKVDSFLQCKFTHIETSGLHEKNVGRPANIESQAKQDSDILKVQHGTIDEIAEEVGICTSCDLHKTRVLPVSGGGGSKAKLFIVGGWLITDAGRDVNAGESAVFGEEEDMMVERMLKAMQLSREESFISNVIKCGIGANVQPKAANIDACLSYLHRQIAAVSPKIICTMGLVATRSLLEKSQPLSQLRGRFHTFKLNKDTHIPLMPTYHPSFLLQNPEMKQATWNDLQMIQKALKN
jgi:DNA polymerase